MIPFVKTQALGNDFLLVHQSSAPPPERYAELARRICERHFGVGADGLILWKQTVDKFDIRIFNRDGSEAESSGNGLRCAAAYFFESGLWRQREIRLETVSGSYILRQVDGQYEADMGTPEVLFVNRPIPLPDTTVNATATSTGNPHCSVFVDLLDDAFVCRIGPELERHSLFPKRTNVEFIHVLSSTDIEVAFWERGVGVTHASGTGSCGATVASIVNGKTGRSVTVHTKTGELYVEWPEGGRLKLTSTAYVVAEGRYVAP